MGILWNSKGYRVSNHPLEEKKRKKHRSHCCRGWESRSHNQQLRCELRSGADSEVGHAGTGVAQDVPDDPLAFAGSLL